MSLLGAVVAVILVSAPEPARAAPLTFDAAGAWQTARDVAHGHRIVATVAGGVHPARALAGCDGFIDSRPALTLQADPGVGAVDIVAYADQPVRVIVYRGAGERICGELAYRSAVRVRVEGQRYRVYLAGAHAGLRHPVVVGAAPATEVPRTSHALERPAVRLERRHAIDAWRPRVGIESRALGRGFDFENRTVYPLAPSLNTVVDGDRVLVPPAPGGAPLVVGGPVAARQPAGRCGRPVLARYRVRVTEPGVLALGVPDHEPRLIEVIDPDGAHQCIGGRALAVRPGVYTMAVIAPEPVTGGYALMIGRCATGERCDPSTKAIGADDAATVSSSFGLATSAAAPALTAIERLHTESGMCTATHITWRGRPALVTAAHCLYAVAPSGALGRRLGRARLGDDTPIDLTGAVVARSFERCARRRLSYHACARTGADDLAVIPHRGGTAPWPLCTRPPASGEVYSLGYGLTERGLPRALVAARHGLRRRHASGRGTWRAHRRGVYVQAGDSGGPVVAAAPVGRSLPSVCFVVSGLDTRSATPVSLLQPVWDLAKRLE